MSPKQKSWRSKAPTLNEQIKVIELDTFHYIVRIIVTDSIEDSYVYREHIFGGMGGLANTQAVHIAMPEGISYIILPYDCGAGTLAHEVSHAVWNIFEHIGAKPEDEIQAYLTGYLVRQATLFIMKAVKIRAKEKEKAEALALEKLAAETKVTRITDTAK